MSDTGRDTGELREATRAHGGDTQRSDYESEDEMNEKDQRLPSVSWAELWRRIEKHHHLYASDEPDANETEGCTAEFAEAMSADR